jgi:hypothetical protein
MEIAMTILTIGKRLISLEQIAYVEPFDPAANPEFKPASFGVRSESDWEERLLALGLVPFGTLLGGEHSVVWG